MPQAISLVKEAHNAISKTLSHGSIAIDATCGNGYDTLFLAQQVGKTGTVYGFDIQQRAVEITEQKLREQQLLSQVQLIHAGHEEMSAYVPVKYHQNINAIMFNLGYLPGSDKAVITKTDTTLIALETACLLLKQSGIITVIAYPGHPGGLQELEALQNQINALDKSFFQHDILEVDKNDLSKPKLFFISKKSSEFI